MTFASEEDEPPAYINEHRSRHQSSWTRVTRADSWRHFRGIPSVRSPSPTFSGDFSPQQTTPPLKEMPLRPNRRQDVEFGKEDVASPSQVLLPAFISKKPTRKKSSGGNSAKSWLKNIKSPIGEPRYTSSARPSRLLITASSRYDAIGSSVFHFCFRSATHSCLLVLSYAFIFTQFVLSS